MIEESSTRENAVEMGDSVKRVFYLFGLLLYRQRNRLQDEKKTEQDWNGDGWVCPHYIAGEILMK